MVLDNLMPGNIHKWTSKLYVTMYALILAITCLRTTMFNIPWPLKFMQITLVMVFIVTSPKMVLDRLNTHELVLYLFIFFSFLGSFAQNGYMLLLFPLPFILGAKNLPFRTILHIFCVVTGAILVITMVFSQLGLVENLVYGNRISFGFVYPTDFAAHIFFFVLAYCYLRKDRLTYIELAGILGLSIFTMIFNHARTNSICLFLTFAVFLYLKVKTEVSSRKGTDYKMNPNLSKVLVMSIPICAALIIGLTVLYHYWPSNAYLITLNNLLSTRLHLGSLGLERYGIHLFGSPFAMVGFGGTLINPGTKYFFLDSSYVLMLIRYGLLVFISVVGMFVYNSWRAFKQNDYILLWILALISLQCVMEHHLLEIAYNPFLLLAFSQTSLNNK